MHFLKILTDVSASKCIVYDSTIRASYVKSFKPTRIKQINRVELLAQGNNGIL